MSITPVISSASRPPTQVTNVSMGQPEIVGPATDHTKALLAKVANEVKKFNEMPMENKLGIGSLHNLLGNVGAPKSRSAA